MNAGLILKNMEIYYRKALLSDLDEVFGMFKAAIAEMDRNGIPQWDELYPDRAQLAEDIENNKLTVGISGGVIACAYVVNSEADDDYRNGAWRFPDASFLVIHRLCVNPKFQRQGLGTRTVEHIEAEIRKQGTETVRLDAFTRNPYALRMYEKLGYVKVGTADWRMGRFWLMEKKL